MIPVIHRIRERPEQHAAKIFIDNCVAFTTAADAREVGIENTEKLVAEFLGGLLVVPGNTLAYVVDDCRQDTNFSHARRSLSLWRNWSSDSAESGSLRNASHRSSS